MEPPHYDSSNPEFFMVVKSPEHSITIVSHRNSQSRCCRLSHVLNHQQSSPGFPSRPGSGALWGQQPLLTFSFQPCFFGICKIKWQYPSSGPSPTIPTGNCVFSADTELRSLSTRAKHTHLNCVLCLKTKYWNVERQRHESWTYMTNYRVCHAVKSSCK